MDDAVNGDVTKHQGQSDDDIATGRMRSAVSLV